MSAFWSYAATLLVYLGVNTIACWGLNLQFGVGGVMNFAFILYQAMGAYITAVLTLPAAATQVDERYILGWHLPWPLPLAGAAVAVALRRCRDFGIDPDRWAVPDRFFADQPGAGPAAVAGSG